MLIHEKTKTGRCKNRRGVFGALKKSGIIFAAVFLAVLVLTFVHMVSAAPPEPVPSIELTSQNTSFDNHEAGAWKVTKWAGWSGKRTARVVFDIESVLKKKNEHDDVIFVINRSHSMIMNSTKQPLIDAINNLSRNLLEDDQSSVALVAFDHQYEILTDFTNDETVISQKLDEISFRDYNRNYYQGMNGAEMLLRNYVQRTGHGVEVILISDGAPNEEQAFQKAQYRYIKNKYPFIDITVIQYEMGATVSELIQNASDRQYSATVDNITDVIF